MNDPVVTPVARLNTRSTWMLPVAPAKRPVPPVTVAVSVMAMTLGGSTIRAVPARSAVMVSPFAAVRMYVPTAVRVDWSTMCGACSLNFPRWVAVPVASI